MAQDLPVRVTDPETGQWDPLALLRNFEFLRELILRTFPAGVMLVMKSNATCPDGFTKHAANNGAYLRITTGSPGGSGGSLDVTTDPTTPTGSQAAVDETSHTKKAVIAPPFFDVILCVKD